MLILTLGLHWALLQGVAWTGMLISYAQAGSLKEAVVKTFDGEHPCPLCKVIREGREEAQQESKKPVSPTLKLELGPIWEPLEFCFSGPHDRVLAVDCVALVRTCRPPKPPPRGLLDERHALM